MALLRINSTSFAVKPGFSALYPKYILFYCFSNTAYRTWLWDFLGYMCVLRYECALHLRHFTVMDLFCMAQQDLVWLPCVKRRLCVLLKTTEYIHGKKNLEPFISSLCICFWESFSCSLAFLFFSLFFFSMWMYCWNSCCRCHCHALFGSQVEK